MNDATLGSLFTLVLCNALLGLSLLPAFSKRLFSRSERHKSRNYSSSSSSSESEEYYVRPTYHSYDVRTQPTSVFTNTATAPRCRHYTQDELDKTVQFLSDRYGYKVTIVCNCDDCRFPKATTDNRPNLSDLLKNYLPSSSTQQTQPSSNQNVNDIVSTLSKVFQSYSNQQSSKPDGKSEQPDMVNTLVQFLNASRQLFNPPKKEEVRTESSSSSSSSSDTDEETTQCSPPPSAQTEKPAEKTEEKASPSANPFCSVVETVMKNMGSQTNTAELEKLLNSVGLGNISKQ